jgi:hypothetical protein
VRYTQAAERRLEEALRGCVRRSLLELSRLVNGDKKQPVQPIFRRGGALPQPCRFAWLAGRP